MTFKDMLERLDLIWFKIKFKLKIKPKFKKRKNIGLPDDLTDELTVATIEEHNTYFRNLKNLKICLREREEHLKQLEESISQERILDRKSTRLNSSHIPLSRMP